MLGKKLINPGAVACTTDTTQILDGGTTQSTALYRFEDNANDTASGTGKFGKGARFTSALTTRVDLSSNAAFAKSNDFSLSMWFYIDTMASSDNQTILAFNTIGTPRYFIMFNNGNIGNIRFYGGGSTNRYSANSIFSAGSWYHLAVSKSSTAGLVVYLNGAAVITQTGETAAYTNGGQANSKNCIGAYYVTNSHLYPFKGKIDQFRVFNKPITQAEVNTLYAETSSTVNTLQILGDTSCIATYTFEGNADDLSNNYDATATSDVAYDYSGTESNITYVAGKFNKAAVFNGTSSAIALPVGDLGLGTNNLSISLWFNSADITQNDQSLFWFQHYQNPIRLGASVSSSSYGGDNDLRFYCMISSSGNQAYSNSNILSNNTWYHAVFVKSSTSGMTVYINGSSVATNTSATGDLNSNMTSGGANSIGYYKTTASGQHFNGSIDQFRIFNKALNAGEVNSLYNETTTTAALGTITNPSTVAYYKMADATDETGSYDGTASTVNFNVQGKYGFAGKFNGSNSVISASNPNSSGGARSFSAWIKTTSTAFQGIITNGGGSHASGLNMFVYNNKLYSTSGKGNGENYGPTSSASINTGDWVHCVLTMSGTAIGSTLKTYVNGSLDGTHTTTVLITDTYDAFRIGGRYINSSNAAYFNGSIDQVRIFNKAISASEVTALYNEVQCANTITTPESYFNTVTYSNPSTSQAYAVGFAPDFVWFKERGGANSHQLYDTIRTDHEALFSNTNDDEYDYSSHPSGDLAPTITSTGFTTPAVVNNGINNSSNNYVAWAWKAASSNTTNNDGTIASTVRASQETGFSIVTYSPNNTVGMSIGHGLSKAPSLVITKRLDTDQDWGVYNNVSTGNATTNWLSLNDSDAYGSGNYMNIKSSTLELPATGAFWSSSSSNQVAYCFANVDGYQRIGSYAGNGLSTGPSVFTGFEPAWVIIKRTDTGDNWIVYDNKRNTALFPNLTSNELSGYNNLIKFVSNGFTVNTTDGSLNNSSGNYIFLAIAANPDTTAPTKANSFETVLYSGDNNSSTGQQVTVGFKPDFTWIKQRNISGVRHLLTDSITGPSVYTGAGYTHHTNETFSSNTYGEFTSFDDNGFTVKYWSGSQYFNTTGKNYVAWNWKALDHDRNLAAINNDGTIPTLVSANPEAGFSVIQYNNGGSFNQFGVGHGLTSAPQIVFQKSLSATGDWYVITTAIDGSVDYLKLNTSDQKADMPSTYVNFQLGNNNFSNWWSASNVINYCWHSVAGYSKIDKYSGSGSSGKEVALDFNPSFVLIKRTNASTGWVIIDDQRGTKELYANLSNIEDTTTASVVLGTNKFTLNTVGSWYNASGGVYLYMAFK